MDREIDPAIAAKHQAMFADLENELDGLDSDEDEGPTPPPKKVEKPKPKPQPKPVQKKKDPLSDYGLGGGNDDNGLGALEAQLGGSELDDLEKQLEGMSDEDLGLDDEDDLAKQIDGMDDPHEMKPAKPSPSKADDKKSEFEQPTPKPKPKPQPSTSQTSSVVKSNEFPFCLFNGANVETLIKIDKALHGQSCLQTLLLANNEIKTIITPCLESSQISQAAKKYLIEKKNALVKVQANIQKLFKEGKLNNTKYIQIIQAMKTKNNEVLSQLANQPNSENQVDRIKKRLEVLKSEEQKISGGGSSSSGNTSTSNTTSTSQKVSSKSQTRQPEEQKVSKIKVGPPEKLPSVENTSEIEGMGSSGLLKNYSSMPLEELLEITKKRRAQLYNLCHFMLSKLVPHADDKEKTRLVNEVKKYKSVYEKADDFIAQMEGGDKPSSISGFLKEHLFDVLPEHLHGKSLDKRDEDLHEYIKKIEECIDQENDYMTKLKQQVEDTRASIPLSKKIKDCDALIGKYNKYIEYLSKLEGERNAWVPTPKVAIERDQRTLSLLNKDIPADSMVVSFKKLSNIKNRKYWIRWTIDTNVGRRTYESSYCDDSTLMFDYNQTIKVGEKDKMDNKIDQKQIHFQILFKKVGLFELKKGEGEISLVELRKTNILEGKTKAREDGIELHYQIQVREPLLRHSRMEILKVKDFIAIPAFQRDVAPMSQSTNPSSTQNQSTVPKKQEESKSQVVQPKTGGGGTKPAAPKQPEQATYPALVLLIPKNDPLKGLQQSDIPEGCTLDYALNPTNPDQIKCLTVLTNLSEKLEKAIPGLASEGRRSERNVVSDNWNKAFRGATALQNAIGEGDIEMEDYFEGLKKAVEIDLKLLKLYHGKGDQARTAFIAEKIKLTRQEIAEFEKEMGG